MYVTKVYAKVVPNRNDFVILWKKNEKRGNFPLFFACDNVKSWDGLWKQCGAIVELPDMNCGKIPHVTSFHTSNYIFAVR